MFDKLTAVAELRRRLADTAPPPVTAMSSVGVLPVVSPLDQLLPQGGLVRGSIVSVQPESDSVLPGAGHSGSLLPGARGSSGLTSLLFALLAQPSAGEGARWSALVGFGDLGLAAAAELGVDLARTVLIPHPGADVSQILSVLIDGVDVIAVHAPSGAVVTPARQRVLASRLRQRGAVLLAVGRWPGADLTVTVSTVGWSGLGAGHGRLRDRELRVRLGGRRVGGRTPEVRMLLSAAPDRVLIQPGLPLATRLAPVAEAG